MKIFFRYTPPKDDRIEGVVRAILALATVCLAAFLADSEIVSQLSLYTGITITEPIVWVVALSGYLLFVLLAAMGIIIRWGGAGIAESLYTVVAGIADQSIQIKESWFIRSRTQTFPIETIGKVETKDQFLRIVNTDGSTRAIRLILLPTDVSKLAKAMRKALKGHE